MLLRARYPSCPFVFCQPVTGSRKLFTQPSTILSFLWLLIWCIVHASKDIEGAKAANGGIRDMLDAWSGDVKSNKSKFAAARDDRKDAVFGDLIQEWLGIFDRASKEAEKIVNLLPSISLGGSTWNQACDWLESYCVKIYEDVLKSAFGHLDRVRNYPDWEAVVAANVQAHAQTPAQAIMAMAMFLQDNSPV